MLGFVIQVIIYILRLIRNAAKNAAQGPLVGIEPNRNRRAVGRFNSYQRTLCCIFRSRSWSGLKMYIITWITNPNILILLTQPGKDMFTSYYSFKKCKVITVHML